MKAKHRRLTGIAAALVLLGAAVALVLVALEDNIVFFHGPSAVVAGEAPEGRAFRLGGVVEEGSVARADNLVTFRVTDFAHVVPVRFDGLLPDLFREGQGVVAQGRMEGGTFVASEVLAKHDENYMPPEVAEALKASGQWKGGGAE